MLWIGSGLIFTNQGRTATVDGLAPCVVFLAPNTTNTSKAVGSGLLVTLSNKVFLVTAEHVARAVGADLIIVMPNGDGKAATATLKNPLWKFSTNADVAVAPLITADTNTHSNLEMRSLPGSLLPSAPFAPGRAITITMMGYPLGLGSSGYVSPLSIDAKTASGLITLPRADTHQLATFIILQTPTIGGLSGGPVFDTGGSFISENAMVLRSGGVTFIGIVHGTISDQTGGKLGAITPASEVTVVIRSFFD